MKREGGRRCHEGEGRRAKVIIDRMQCADDDDYWGLGL